MGGVSYHIWSGLCKPFFGSNNAAVGIPYVLSTCWEVKQLGDFEKYMHENEKIANCLHTSKTESNSFFFN